MKDERRTRGKARQGASFPVAPGKTNLPSSYHGLLQELKARVQHTRLQAVLTANTTLVILYWEIGQSILQRQHQQGWGAKIVDRLANDLREAFPDMQGFSPRNLLFMRAVAQVFPDAVKVKQLVSQLPWGHIILLMQRVKDSDACDWYMGQCIQHGWSRNILAIQIDRQAYTRRGKAINNFAATLPPADSDMAAQAFNDPYLFDFLGTADPRREKEVEQSLIDHIQKFLLELGTGFAFVGRQVHLEINDKNFYLDLLFYHLKLRCYVVIELKAVAFDPAFVGTLNLYLSATDDLLRHPDDKPTIGLLLCRNKDQLVVEYALRDLNKPIGVAQWETQITQSLPTELASCLPTIAEIEAELQNEVGRADDGR